MKTIQITIAGLLFVCLNASAQTITSRTFDIPFNAIIDGLCEGEPVALIGTVQGTSKRTEFKDGTVRIVGTSLVKGEGTGLTTGVKYQMSGNTVTQLIAGPVGTGSVSGIVSASFRNTFRLIGPGPNNDMFLTYLQKQEGDDIVVEDFKGVCK